jgi:hypothetical protein
MYLSGTKLYSANASKRKKTYCPCHYQNLCRSGQILFLILDDCWWILLWTFRTFCFEGSRVYFCSFSTFTLSVSWLQYCAYITIDIYEWAHSMGKMMIRVCLFFPLPTWYRVSVSYVSWSRPSSSVLVSLNSLNICYAYIQLSFVGSYSWKRSIVKRMDSCRWC